MREIRVSAVKPAGYDRSRWTSCHRSLQSPHDAGASLGVRAGDRRGVERLTRPPVPPGEGVAAASGFVGEAAEPGDASRSRVGSDGGLAAQRRPRTISVLRRETVVPQPVDETFAFFADARNLDCLTPDWLGFRILTSTPIEMRPGTVIDYRIRLRGLPIRWRTEITTWDPPFRFVDVQIRGPYRWWHHTHRFEACPNGTRVIDEVEYRAPLAWLIHPLMVNRDLRRIFDFREAALHRCLASRAAGRHARGQ